MVTLNTNYRFDIDLAIGQVQEAFLANCFTGKETVEVKTIKAKTHIPLEVYSRGKPSGLARTEADYYFIYLEVYEFGFYLTTEKLQDLAREFAKEQPKSFSWGGDDNTSFLTIIPIRWLLNKMLRKE